MSWPLRVSLICLQNPGVLWFPSYSKELSYLSRCPWPQAPENCIETKELCAQINGDYGKQRRALEGIEGWFQRSWMLLTMYITARKRKLLPSADGEARTGKKEKGISLPVQGSGATRPPEGVWVNPRLCVTRQRQAGRRTVSKGRGQPGGAAGG